MTINFYKSKQWIKSRDSRLRQDQYICQECKRYGKTKAAAVVHHIKPLRWFWELRLNIKNLISLCKKCHDGMHDRTNDELSAKGLELLDRVYPPTS